MAFFVLFASTPNDSGQSRSDTASAYDSDAYETHLADEVAESEPLPNDHPAYDRIQTRVESDEARRKVGRRTLVGIVIFALALLATYYVVRASDDDTSDSPDLLELAVANAPSVRLGLQTEDLDEAEDYILGEFGWPIRVPVLASSRLVGVGVDEIAGGVELPVLQYATGENEPVTVYVYDYAFLDAAAGRLSLAPAVYARLAEEGGVDVRRIDENYVILWRRRAVVYTAVTLEDPTPIAEGLRRGR